MNTLLLDALKCDRYAHFMGWPGEKVLTRLIDLLESGVGGVLRPWQIRRVEGANAEARRQERLLLEQTEQDIREIRRGRLRVDASGKLIAVQGPPTLLLTSPVAGDHEGEVAPPSTSSLSFSQAAHDTAVAQEMQRAVNLKRVALYAEEDAEALDQEASEDEDAQDITAEVDPDWLTKWVHGAQDVSREELQRLWARLLTGEVRKPGSFTLRTVDFLSRLSSSEAELIAKVAPYVLSDTIIKLDNEFFAKKGLVFSELLYLDDIGIINGTTGLGLTLNVGTSIINGKFFGHMRCNGEILLFDLGEVGEQAPTLTFPAYSTTKLGREVLSLASFEPDEDYIQRVAKLGIENGAREVLRGKMRPNGREYYGIKTIAKKDAG